jgi:hypothetical protein
MYEKVKKVGNSYIILIELKPFTFIWRINTAVLLFWKKNENITTGRSDI